MDRGPIKSFPLEKFEEKVKITNKHVKFVPFVKLSAIECVSFIIGYVIYAYGKSAYSQKAQGRYV